MRLVQDDHRAHHLEDVEQALRHGPVNIRRVKVGEIPAETPVTQGIVVVGEERHVAARVPEHPQEIPVILPVGRLQGYEHHAEVVLHVGGGEGVILLQHFDPSAAAAFQHLPVGVLAVPQLLLGLPVDGVAGNHPQHQAGVLVKALKRGGGQ